jgi:hypothetical protein
MRKAGILIIFSALAAAFATTAFAQAARTKVVVARGARQVTPVQVLPIVDSRRCSFVCRQDLFDRNNPNNLRSDYHAPPAQPGQY